MTTPTADTAHQAPAPGLPTVAEVVAACADEFTRAELFYGHGTEDGRDEAAALVFHVLGLDHGDQARAYRQTVPAPALRRIRTLVERRIVERRPLPYLLGEAWFAGLPFSVDERVLIPRSPFAELIQSRFAPWIDPGRVTRILDLCTGSGCMAIACAIAFTDSSVVASDISADALAVARDNVDRHRLGGRVTLVEADLFDGLTGRFDLIVSNPPYVPSGDIAAFPPEYGHEPRIALEAGADGMETPARILHHAAPHLSAGGWLALEVGEGATRLEGLFPTIPFIWPELENGGDGIALVGRADLPGGLAQE